MKSMLRFTSVMSAWLAIVPFIDYRLDQRPRPAKGYRPVRQALRLLRQHRKNLQQAGSHASPPCRRVSLAAAQALSELLRRVSLSVSVQSRPRTHRLLAELKRPDSAKLPELESQG